MEDRTVPSAVLVKDINPGPLSSDPYLLMNVNGILYCRAGTAAAGFELWRSDGTEAGTQMVRDINPGAFSSNPASFCNVNGTLFFTADDGVHGTELWRTDAVQGAVLVKDINPGPLGSYPSNLTNVNGTLYFSAGTAAAGFELWRSDGTEAGTQMVRDINPGPFDSSPANLTNVNGTLFFTATDPVNGTELWRTDAVQGAVLVKDINPGPLGSYPHVLTNVNGTLYFVAGTAAAGYELWRSDGTAAGTQMVRDINPGPFDSEPHYLTNVNGTLFFAATDPVNGTELWRTDPVQGAVLVKDINPGPLGSYPSNLTNVNGTLYFSAGTAAAGFELWRSDGTAAGTQMVRDINPGAFDSDPQFLTNVNGTLFFTAYETGHGTELWRTDPVQGAVLVKDINPGPLSSDPHALINVNGTLYFVAGTATAGNELWSSDGTEAGTQMVEDINPGSFSSDPQFLTNVNGTLFFTAYEPVHGTELWKVGTPPDVVVTSTAQGDTIVIRNKATDPTWFEAVVNGVIRFSGPWAGLHSITINALAINDTINIESGRAGQPITINGGGNDTINISPTARNLSNIQGSFTINGHAGTDTLHIFDQAASSGQSYTITSTSGTRPGAGLFAYSSIGALQVDCGNGNNTINLSSTAAGATTTVNGGSGNDTFLVGGGSSGLNGVQGHLIVDGGGGTNAAIFDDQNATNNAEYDFSGSQLVRYPTTGSPVTMSFLNIGSLQLNGGQRGVSYGVFGGAPVTTINGGPGNNHFAVNFMPAGRILNINTGPGDNSVLIGQGGYLDLHGTVSVAGGGGNNTLAIGDIETSGDSYALSATQFTVGRLPTFALSYSGFTTVGLSLGDYVTNVVHLSGIPAGATVSISAGSHSNTTLAGPDAPNTWAITGATSGSLNGTVSFSGIKNLLGGAGNDSFVFSDGQGLSGSIDGGGGTNTLDYSAYSSNVVVDLQTNTGTGIGGNVLNIQNVTGGNGGGAGTYNILVGNGGNVLTGGNGRRNLLIAGPTPSTLIGGNDDDILIGGSTAYDTEAGLVSLNAIMAYWSATADDYATRVANLLSGNGVPLLDATMVLNNGGGNTLLGNNGGTGELNLFYGTDPSTENTDFNPAAGEFFVLV